MNEEYIFKVIWLETRSSWLDHPVQGTANYLHEWESLLQLTSFENNRWEHQEIELNKRNKSVDESIIEIGSSTFNYMYVVVMMLLSSAKVNKYFTIGFSLKYLFHSDALNDDAWFERFESEPVFACC